MCSSDLGQPATDAIRTVRHRDHLDLHLLFDGCGIARQRIGQRARRTPPDDLGDLLGTCAIERVGVEGRPRSRFLERFPDAVAPDRVRGLLYRAELTVRAGNDAAATASLEQARAIPPNQSDREGLAADFASIDAAPRLTTLTPCFGRRPTGQRRASRAGLGCQR